MEESSNNITLRKHQIMQRSNSLNSILNNDSLNSTSSENELAKSFDLSSNRYADDMKLEISHLKGILISTQNELDNILLENNQLKKTILELNREVKILKQFCTTPASSLRKHITLSSKKSAKRQLTDSFRESPVCLPKNMSTTTFTDSAQKEPLHSLRVNESQTNLNKNAPQPNQKPKELQSEQSNTMISQNISNPDNYTPSKHGDKKRAFIFGGQQCSGLTTHLINSRLHSPYHDYQFISFIKPHATTEEILISARLFDISEQDRVIIFIGQNDSNPFKIHSELCTFIKSIKSHIIVFKVRKNQFLNEQKINSMLNMICKQYVNCTYVDIDYNSLSNFHHNLCNKINSTLDQIDYNQNFLSLASKTVNGMYKRSRKTHQIGHLNERDSVLNKTSAQCKDQSTQTESVVSQKRFFRIK